MTDRSHANVLGHALFTRPAWTARVPIRAEGTTCAAVTDPFPLNSRSPLWVADVGFSHGRSRALDCAILRYITCNAKLQGQACCPYIPACRHLDVSDEIPVSGDLTAHPATNTSVPLEYVLNTQTTCHQPNEDGSFSTHQTAFLVPSCQVFDALNGSATDVAAGKKANQQCLYAALDKRPLRQKGPL